MRATTLFPRYELSTTSVLSTPFNVILLADNLIRRNDLRRYLIEAQIYSPIHWELSESVNSEILDISQRILTVPIDYRYTHTDLDRVVISLVEFIE